MIRRDAIGIEGILVELSKDSVRGREMTCNIAAMRKRTLDIGGEIRGKGCHNDKDRWGTNHGEEDNELGWMKWKGKKITRMYTDGSYKEEKTLRSMLLGGHKVKAGGGIVVAGEGWYSPLRVLMDVEVDSAFPVETITLLVSCLIAEGEGDIKIGSDCKGAMAAVNKKNKSFNRILPKYKPGKNIEIHKVKAHPERREGIWEGDDEGIWLADKIAGGEGGNMVTIKATSALNYLGSLGAIAIVDNNNIPFIGNIMKRSSVMRREKYFIRRDKYREDKGMTGIWEGSSLHNSYKMLGKAGSMEDKSAINRIAAGKRWKMSRHNLEICHACGEDSRSNHHALRKCKAKEVVEARKIWMDEISKKIMKTKDRDIRGLLEDMWAKMRYRRGGEMAMVGCFQPRLVELMMKGTMPLRDGEDRKIMNILKAIGKGARELLKVYTEVKGMEGKGKELRQTNLMGFFRGGITRRNGERVQGRGNEDKGKKKARDKKKAENKIYRKGGFEVMPSIGGVTYWKFKDR